MKGTGESSAQVRFLMDDTLIDAKSCKPYQSYAGTEGFLERAGVLTFLKTPSELQIWFDDVLEVTWVYEDLEGQTCGLRDQLVEMKFEGADTGNSRDRVSIQYRYTIGRFQI